MNEQLSPSESRMKAIQGQKKNSRVRFNSPMLRNSNTTHKLGVLQRAPHFYTNKQSVDNSQTNDYGSSKMPTTTQPQLSSCSSYNELSTPVKHQDNYLKNFKTNRRVAKEKEAQQLWNGEGRLQSSYSLHSLFRKKPQIHERAINMNGKRGSQLSIKLELDRSNSGNKVVRDEKKDLDEWQTRLKLIRQLKEIEQKNKAYFQEEDQNGEKYENPNQIFQQHIFNKIQKQNKDVPLSLVAIQANRKFLIDRLMNQRGILLEEEEARNNNEKEKLAHIAQIRKNPQSFLLDLKKKSESKFQQQLLTQEIKEQRAKKMVDIRSRSQFQNAQSQFRFLPKKKQKKMINEMGVMINEKYRYRAINNYLSNCISGKDLVVEEVDDDFLLEDL